jgi:hypothetical protein
MSRYGKTSDLVAKLFGVNLGVFSGTTFGENTANRDAFLDSCLLEADSLVDEFCQENYTPLQNRFEAVSGDGSTSLVLKHTPITDVQRVTVTYDPLGLTNRIDAPIQRLDPDSGLLVIKPTFAVQGAIPVFGGAAAYNYAFAPGRLNVWAQYRSGFSQVGNNVGMDVIPTLWCPRVANVWTDASYAYFDCAQPYGPYSAGEKLNTITNHKMLKGGVDDSSHWTMVSSSQLKCAIADYSAGSIYLLCYVPLEICSSATEWATARALVSLGTKSHKGSSGGGKSWKAGPFGEDFGDYQYAGHVKEMQQSAQDKLRRFRRVSVC